MNYSIKLYSDKIRELECADDSDDDDASGADGELECT
jgi:hypothetical protein